MLMSMAQTSALIGINDLIAIFDESKNKLMTLKQFSYYPSKQDIPYRFSVQKLNAAKEYLLLHGFVVFKNVINNQEIIHSKQLFWEWIKQTNAKWEKNDISTWKMPKSLGYKKTGVMYGQGIGQSELQWFLRTRPKLLHIFKQLWNDKDLLTSFDGIGIYRPFNEYAEYKTREQWFHVDQHYAEYPDFNVYQGVVALQEQTVNTGGTVIISDSHLLFKEATGNIEGGFKRLSTDHWMLKDDKFTKLMIQMEAGDLLIWDGRTVHCNTYCLKDDEMKQNEGEFVRMVSYITMSPKSKIKGDDEEEYYKYRLKAYRDKSTTGHWPHKRNTVSELTGSELDTLKRNTFELMTDQIKALVGWKKDKPDWYDIII